MRVPTHDSREAPTPALTRRSLLANAALAFAGAATSASLWARAARASLAVGGDGPHGPLMPPDANGIQLPCGFESRVVARGGELVASTSHRWHLAADGGATFPVRRGYVYVSNSELPAGAGGVSALRFDHRGRIRDAYSICSGTRRNCAGGATPWQTWLSCEEVDRGLVFECDPKGKTLPVARPALGAFQHEAVAVDPQRRRLYLTEDERDGVLYRFTPTKWGSLEEGLLEVATGTHQRVSWAPVPDPTPGPGSQRTRHQVAGAQPFDGGEGIVWHGGSVFFTTKGDNRVWRYDPRAELLEVLYEASRDPTGTLSGVDNVTASRTGDLIVAEDPGNLELVLIRDGIVSPLVRVTGQANTELTGPAFDPTERRLYFSSQRGEGGGITYEVTGPFRLM